MKNLVKATTIAFALTLAMLAGQASAQNTNSTTTTTQSSPSTQSSSQTTRETTTTTQTKPTQTTTSETRTSVDPLWLVIGGIALLALLLIIFLSMRKRPRGDGDTVYESKTVIKKE
jgi:cytoskeletal protein RodZ